MLKDFDFDIGLDFLDLDLTIMKYKVYCLFSTEIHIPFFGLRITSARRGISVCFMVVFKLNFLKTEESKTFSSIMANLKIEVRIRNLLEIFTLLLANAVPGASRERNISIRISLGTVLRKESVWVKGVRVLEDSWVSVKKE